MRALQHRAASAHLCGGCAPELVRAETWQRTVNHAPVAAPCVAGNLPVAVWYTAGRLPAQQGAATGAWFTLRRQILAQSSSFLCWQGLKKAHPVDSSLQRTHTVCSGQQSLHRCAEAAVRWPTCDTLPAQAGRRKEGMRDMAGPNVSPAGGPACLGDQGMNQEPSSTRMRQLLCAETAV